MLKNRYTKAICSIRGVKNAIDNTDKVCWTNVRTEEVTFGLNDRNCHMNFTVSNTERYRKLKFTNSL